MRNWKRVILILGLIAITVTGLYPRDDRTNFFDMFLPYPPYCPLDLALFWLIEGVAIYLILLSLSDTPSINLRQRIVLCVTALAIIITMLFTPSIMVGYYFFFTYLRYLQNDVDYARLMVIWISIGMASRYFFVGLSDEIWRRSYHSFMLFLGALLFLIVGFFPAHESDIRPMPHWIYEYLDDEGNHQLNWKFLLGAWSLIAIAMTFIGKRLSPDNISLSTSSAAGVHPPADESSMNV